MYMVKMKYVAYSINSKDLDSDLSLDLSIYV